MKTHTLSQKRQGFTLVELLVVITIIVVLASLAVVGVRSGLRSADAGKTKRNMKDIYGVLASLASEGVNTGHHAPGDLPPYRGNLQDDQEAPFLWWDLVAEGLNIADRDSGRYRWVTAYSKTLLQNPLSKRKLGQGKDTFDSLHNDPDLSHGGYAYNAELGGDVSSDEQEGSAYRIRSSAVKDPSETIYFGEADDNQETAGWVFKNIKNAPQGNYKDSAHCCMVGGNVRMIKNVHLKEQNSYNYYTQFEDKNYDHKPSE